MHIMAQDVKVKIAGGGSTGTGAIWTPIAVDCSGYDRAEVVVARGAQAGATKGNVYASVYESTATGGTYAVISGSNGTAGTAKSNMAILIDVALDPTKPFLKVYGTSTAASGGTSAIPVVASVHMYRGSRSLPPTQDINAILA